jgi:hypothetical protein
MSSGMWWRFVGRMVIDIAFTPEAQAVRGKWPALQLAILFGLLHPLCCFEMWGDIHPLTHWHRVTVYSRISSALVFADFLNEKKLVHGSNLHLSFNRPLRAAPSEVTRWVSAAWKAIPESIIIRSFKKCCISTALAGSEDDILWENNCEDGESDE